jgi:uncharacterized protein
MMRRAYAENYPLHIREVERIAQLMAGFELAGNEQVEPWASIVVAADGSVSTFSPELMEASAPAYSDFIFGNILNGDLDDFAQSGAFSRTSQDVTAGIAACKDACRYFGVCGGGSPVNKFSENGDLTTTETDFCRLTTQVAADAMMSFLHRHRQCCEPSSLSTPE